MVKTVDESTAIRCASGIGVIREEVWVDDQEVVARYNLAFINHFLTRKDNGRVLGFDNKHGTHHRHDRGIASEYAYISYGKTFLAFLEEVGRLRKVQR